MKKVSTILLPIALTATSLSAAPASKLQGFDKFTLGMPFSELVSAKAACDAPRDTPDFRDSLEQGVSSTVCPTSETFAMATLLENKVAAIAVNWVSWDVSKLRESSPTLSQVATELRRKYGIPSTTVAYESQFGNREADALCKGGEYTCQMHIWKSHSPDRVANLVFAKNAKGEIPLLFNLTDLESEAKIEAIKNRRLQAEENVQKKPQSPAH